jgi:hypothetical protein
MILIQNKKLISAADENKVGFRGAFSASKICPLRNHMHHAKHHKFTIKNHPPHIAFSKTPLKNARKNSKTPEQYHSLRGSTFFL